MPTTVITAEDVIRRYAEDIAYVAEDTPATGLDAFIDHLDTAAGRYSMAGILGHEDLETAAVLLAEASICDDEAARTVFLRRADALLAPIVWDMTQEYRGMVGD